MVIVTKASGDRGCYVSYTSEIIWTTLKASRKQRTAAAGVVAAAAETTLTNKLSVPFPPPPDFVYCWSSHTEASMFLILLFLMEHGLYDHGISNATPG